MVERAGNDTRAPDTTGADDGDGSSRSKFYALTVGLQSSDQ